MNYWYILYLFKGFLVLKLHHRFLFSQNSGFSVYFVTFFKITVLFYFLFLKHLFATNLSIILLLWVLIILLFSHFINIRDYYLRVFSIYGYKLWIFGLYIFFYYFVCFFFSLVLRQSHKGNEKGDQKRTKN